MGEKIKELKARAVLIDMEERVVNSVVQGPLRDLLKFWRLMPSIRDVYVFLLGGENGRED